MGTTHLGLQPGKLTHGWRLRNKKESDAWLAEQYERHNQHVMDHTPPQQLLIFNVKQGWGPLCKFLDCPTPKTADGDGDVPFPHSKVNDKAALLKLKKTFLMAVYGWIPLVVVSLSGGVVGAWYMAKGCHRESRTSRFSK